MSDKKDEHDIKKKQKSDDKNSGGLVALND